MVHSVWDYLLLRARLGPHELAVHAPRGPVSRAILLEEVAGLATELLEQGLGDERMIGLAFETSYLHLLLVLALDRLNLPSTSLPMPLEPAALAAHVQHYGVTTLITSEPAPAAAPCRWIRMPDQHRPRIGRADPGRLAAIEPTDNPLVRVIWSSGTTGRARGTPVTRAKQMRRIELVSALRTHGSETRQFLAMGLGAAYDYTDGLGVLMSGGTLVLPSPGPFLGLAKTLGVTAIGMNVGMLRNLLGERPDPMRRLDTMRIDVMGSNLPPKLAREARYLLTSKLCSAYGTTEAVLIATGDAALCAADPSAVGYVVPWTEVEVVDESDEPLPAGKEGILRVRGEQITHSYYGESADAAAEVFRNGWFYPGEIGALSDGLVRVTGRHSDAVRRDDALIGSVPIEAALMDMPGIKEAAVFPLRSPAASRDEICAAVVLEPDADPDALRAALPARLGANAPAGLLVVTSLPRNANGKILKQELQDRMRVAAQGATR